MGEGNNEDWDCSVEDASEGGVEDGLNVGVGEVGVDDFAAAGEGYGEEAVKRVGGYPDLEEGQLSERVEGRVVLTPAAVAPMIMRVTQSSHVSMNQCLRFWSSSENPSRLN